MNEIEQIKGSDGVWREEEDDIYTTLVNYFMNLFKSNAPSQFHKALESVESKVTAEMNHRLTRPFTANEVYKALQEMHQSKAPRLDGMPFFFFQKFWHVIHTDVIITVLNI